MKSPDQNYEIKALNGNTLAQHTDTTDLVVKYGFNGYYEWSMSNVHLLKSSFHC